MTIRSSLPLALAVPLLLAGCGGSFNPSNELCVPACTAGTTCLHGACVEVGVDAGLFHCQSDGECGGKTRRCDQPSGTCVECVANGDCASGVCTAAQSCAPVPDSCSAALLLDLSQGLASVTSTTEAGLDDVKPSCALGQGAKDLVYLVRLPSAGRLVARAIPAEPALYQPVLSLSSRCPGSSTDELACAYASTGTSGGAEVAAELDKGDYFLWLDGDSATSGRFTLTVKLEQPVEGDYCSSPLPLDLSSGLAVVTGSTAGPADGGSYRDDTFGSCGGSGQDVFYSVQVTMPVRLTAEVSSLAQGFDPIVYLRRPGECASESGGSQLACASTSLNSQARIDLPRLEPGTYSLIVDGDSFSTRSSGPFQLKVQTTTALVPPTNDDCSNPTVINQPAGGVGIVTVSGDTSTALSDATSGACGGAAPDVVYALHLTSNRKVIARVTPTSGSWTPVVYVRSAGNCASGDASSLLACNRANQAGGSTAVTVANLPAGDSYLWVDGIGSGAGAFSLSVEFADPPAPPANDGCASPQVLTGSGGLFTVQGTTTGANDDVQTCTYPLGAFGSDVVYRLDVPAQASVSIDVQSSTGSSLQPVIQMKKPNACASDLSSDELFCAWPDPADPSRVTRVLGDVPPGQYFLWVDGDATTHGAFQLKATLGTPAAVPANDSCANSIPLSANVPVVADTRSASNDSSGFCGSGAESSGVFAPDVVFHFDNPSAATRTLTVIPDPYDGKLLRPVVYVRGPGSALCGSLAQSSQVACGVGTTLGGTLTLSLPNLPAGTFYVWVDGVAQQSGRFTLKLQ